MTDVDPQALTNEEINQAAANAASVAVSTAAVNLQFPAIGFIDPAVELEKMRRLVAEMPEADRKSYPEVIRAKLLAWHASKDTSPPVSDEELCLAIYIRRTTDSALTPEDLEARISGKATPKPPKEKAATKKSLDDLLGI